MLGLEGPLIRTSGVVGFVQGFHEPRLKHCHTLTPGSEVLVVSSLRAQGINTCLCNFAVHVCVS